MTRAEGTYFLAEDVSRAIATWLGVSEYELGAKWTELARVFAQLVAATGLTATPDLDRVRRLLGLISDLVLAAEGVVE